MGASQHTHPLEQPLLDSMNSANAIYLVVGKISQGIKRLFKPVFGWNQTNDLQLERCIEIMKEKGASNGILAIPAKKQGVSLNRGEFTDAINLRYYRELRGLAKICACGQKFNITHDMH